MSRDGNPPASSSDGPVAASSPEVVDVRVPIHLPPPSQDPGRHQRGQDVHQLADAKDVSPGVSGQRPPQSTGASAGGGVPPGRTSASWRHLIGPTGRLARVDGGRKNEFLVRADDAEAAELQGRADHYAVSVPALLHVAGRFFEPPPGAPCRFQPSGGRSVVRDRKLATELFRLVPLLQSISRNHNQIAAVANTEGLLLPPQMIALAEKAIEQLDRLNAVLDMLDPHRKGR